MNVLKLIQRQEEFRQFVYDDATGKRLGPGDKIIGHPTVGYGFNLDPSGMGLSQHESNTILAARLRRTEIILAAHIPGFVRLDEVRQAALVSAAYNMGVDGLLNFHNALSAVSAGSWVEAAKEFKDSRWYRNPLTQHRAESTANMIETGEW